jgi:hypothetical protein
MGKTAFSFIHKEYSPHLVTLYVEVLRQVGKLHESLEKKGLPFCSYNSDIVVDSPYSSHS